MPDIIKVIILSIIEGVTEFLPISSTGHLIVASALLDFRPELRDTFDIFIQLGAVAAVILFYRALLWDQARRVRTDRAVQRLWLMIGIAFLPAAVLGILFRGFIKATLFNPVVVAVSLIVGGVIIIVLESEGARRIRLQERRARRATAVPTPPQSPVSVPDSGLENVTLRHAVMIGVAQTIALIPGVSRSAASIFGGMFAGLTRATATQFSFLLAIPTLGGATVAEFVLSLDEINGEDLIYLVAGAVIACIVAWLSIRWLLAYIASHSFVAFGIYRIVVGMIILILYGLNVFG